MTRSLPQVGIPSYQRRSIEGVITVIAMRELYAGRKERRQECPRYWGRDRSSGGGCNSAAVRGDVSVFAARSNRSQRLKKPRAGRGLCRGFNRLRKKSPV